MDSEKYIVPTSQGTPTVIFVVAVNLYSYKQWMDVLFSVNPSQHEISGMDPVHILLLNISYLGTATD